MSPYFDSGPRNSSNERSQTFKEQRQERLQAKERGLTVEQWREKKAVNQAAWRSEQMEKLNASPFKVNLPKDFSVPKSIELCAWDDPTSNVLNFIKNAYLKAGLPEAMASDFARTAQKTLLNELKDDYLAMTSGAILRLQGNRLEAVGLHSNKYGKTVERIAAERMRQATENSTRPNFTSDASSPLHSTPLEFVGDEKGISAGKISNYHPSQDGIVQRADGTWVSDGTGSAGIDTRKPPKF